MKVKVVGHESVRVGMGRTEGICKSGSRIGNVGDWFGIKGEK